MRLGYFAMPLHPPGADPAQTMDDDLATLSKDELIRKLMLGKMQRSEYTNGRNAEIKAWVEEHHEIKEKI